MKISIAITENGKVIKRVSNKELTERIKDHHLCTDEIIESLRDNSDNYDFWNIYKGDFEQILCDEFEIDSMHKNAKIYVGNRLVESEYFKD